MLCDLGIPESAATSCEGSLQHGDTLMSVQCHEADEITRATETLRRHNTPGSRGPGAETGNISGAASRSRAVVATRFNSGFRSAVGYHRVMSRQEVLSTLKAQLGGLHQRFGVVRLTLFGSVARDEAVQGSDVDLLVEFDKPVGLFSFLELQSHLETLLGCAVDLGTPQSLKPRLRARVMAEAVDVV